MPARPDPPTPVPAAVLVLLRDRPAAGGCEVLLIRRHQQSPFAAGDFAFPGGKLEAGDAREDAEAWCAGPSASAAAAALGLGAGPGGLSYWIGALREAFEEVGVLLAYGPDGGPASLDAARAATYRRASRQDGGAFWEMVKAEGLRLATDRLTYFAHWITPEERPLRFDARFFAAEMPDGQAAVADDREIVAVRWLAPGEALAARRRDEISLGLPTVKNLALLDGAPSAAGALARLAGRRVPTIRPRMIREGEKVRVLLPGDPGYF